ncbi:unannotated protein [freshwater metagenome]|uniref:Unannotated protein n=1 Tax=freshwater metagenome TaxID=449393 RepID=A0A6J6TZT4_9ZZZZ
MLADALETCRPKTSAGAKIYFVVPARSQTAIVSVGASVPVPCKLAAFVQSSAANFALTSALTPAVGVAAGSAAPVETALANTWRKRSSAVCPTNSTTRRPESPGTEITI